MSNKYHLNKIVFTVVYSLIYAVGLQFFIIPAGLFSLGITGIGQIIVEVFPKISFGLLYFCLNIPGFILSYYKLGKEFTYYTIISVISVTLFTAIVPVIIFTDELVINAIFGGVISGFGIGGLLKIGSSSGGLDIYGVWYFQKTGLDFKTFTLITNLIIIIVGSFIYSVEVALFTLFSAYFRNVGIGQIFTNNDKLTVWIIGKDLSLVTLFIQSKLKHGTTHFKNAKGGFLNDDKEIIMTILNKYEYAKLINEIHKIQPDVFINVTQTYQIEGNYKEIRKND